MDKLRAITMFCRSVELRSFAAAAQSLEMQPSVLSKGIAALESDVGFTLFNRSTRKLSLTEAGSTYYEGCRQLMLDLEEVEANARDGVARPTGTLRVGLHPVCRFALFAHWGAFLTDHPGLKVETVMTNSPSSLLADGLDVMLRIGRLDDSGLVARQLGWADFVVCAAPAYLQMRGEPLDPTELTQHSAVIYGRLDESPNTKWPFVRGNESLMISVPVSFVSRDGIGLMDAVESGAGIARPYYLAARPYLEKKRVQQVLKDWSCDPQPIFAVYPQSRALPGKVTAFIALSEKTFAT